jgi:hypothetical protein
MMPNPETLKSVFAANSNLSEWATIAVFIGLLGDILVIFVFSKDKPRSETWLAFIFALIIAVGVYGEYAFGSKAASAARELQNISDQKVAESNQKASEADGRAKALEAQVKGYDKQIADAGRDAAQANARAVASGLAFVKLKKQVFWRTLSDTDRKVIGEQLKPFAPGFIGRKVKVSSYFADPEGGVFATEIADGLTRAGINVDSSKIGANIVIDELDFGVWATGPSADENFIRSFATETVKRLDTPIHGQWGKLYPDVGILVGVKPVPSDLKTGLR